MMERLRQKLHISDDLSRATLAEFFGTFFLLWGGNSIAAQFILGRRRFDDWNGVNVGWGIVLIMAVQMTIRISGAHLNPAVSFFLLTQRKIGAVRCILYIVAQTIGAYIGALLCFIVYYGKRVIRENSL
ncbi:aquaporin-9 domain protein [Ancylostoma caninum]|uniref:Aquaporin-9 domain protein n=1 Tax=Ancylostoma caninum TaxID=29170 RepID=A0A368GCS1_ANCCA|nr:aquaporin-9 domain protein [Ancylostoma caninum]